MQPSLRLTVTLAAALVAAVAISSPAAAQLQAGVAVAARVVPAGAYRTATGDTLKYAEDTEATVSMTTPDGQVLKIASTHRSRINIAFADSGRARGWYETLRLTQVGPDSTQRREPVTDSLLRKPFELAVRPNGRMQLVAPPEIPTEIGAMTDLTHQFDDYLIVITVDSLRPGRTWVDTAVVTRARSQAEQYRAERITHYEVRRDTLVNGVQGVVIRVRTELKLSASAPVEGSDARANVTLAGEETGLVVFAGGVMRHRQRDGLLNGEFVLEQQGQRTVLPQKYEYYSASTIRQ